MCNVFVGREWTASVCIFLWVAAKHSSNERTRKQNPPTHLRIRFLLAAQIPWSRENCILPRFAMQQECAMHITKSFHFRFQPTQLQAQVHMNFVYKYRDMYNVTCIIHRTPIEMYYMSLPQTTIICNYVCEDLAEWRRHYMYMTYMVDSYLMAMQLVRESWINVWCALYIPTCNVIWSNRLVLWEWCGENNLMGERRTQHFKISRWFTCITLVFLLSLISNTFQNALQTKLF